LANISEVLSKALVIEHAVEVEQITSTGLNWLAGTAV
jgi:hypothetical protein